MADLHLLTEIFDNHPKKYTEEGVDGAIIPADALLDLLDRYKDASNGTVILNEEEAEQFQSFLAVNPGLGINVTMLQEFVKLKNGLSPSPSPPTDEEPNDPDAQFAYSHSWGETSESFYAESSGTSTFYDGPTSRPPSRGPTTPMKSAFDSDRRQRSTPLNTAPSSWAKRPQPAGRRKSDAGSRSDSEPPRPPSAFGRRNSNTQRTPSVPSSPSMGTTSFRDGPFSPGSPDFTGPRSRPHSRARSHNDFSGYMSPDDGTTMKRPMSRSRYGPPPPDQGVGAGISSIRMPGAGGSDSDEDEEEVGMHLVMDRLHTDSTVSMEMTERLEALQRTNEELGRKRADAEITLQKKLTEHEYELEELNQRIEELRSELAASNREEKELRAKDSRNLAQIAVLEAEVAKLTRSLENSARTYTGLQKQYQEQCSASEKYRDTLRMREETILGLRETVSLHEIETNKWTREHDVYEDRIASLQRDLDAAMEAHSELEEQKQENMMLKETIDRVRFEMDLMRQASDGPGLAGAGGTGSNQGTISRSLGAELQGQLGQWEEEENADEPGSPGSTAVDEEETEGEDDVDEDVIETIITKRKRKVASRAQVIEPSKRREFEEVKEYSDSSTQYDPTLFAVNHGMQTDPEPKVIYASFEIQTDEIPEPPPKIIEVAPAPRATMEMEIQTDEVEVEVPVVVEPSRSPSPAHEESMASSSSTIVPPTPRPSTKHLADQLDEPPAYNQVTEADKEERELRLAADTLKKWHHGVQIPLGPVPGGVSEETVEDWKAIKRELGVDCLVIDRLIAASSGASADASGNVDGKGRAVARRRGRFYNIYNTYVYGDKASASSIATNVISYGLMAFGAGALAVLAVAPHIGSHDAVPGGATYYDRAAWNSFNSFHGAGEGFAPDGTAVVWSFLGRVGGGAARMARGWPT